MPDDPSQHDIMSKMHSKIVERIRDQFSDFLPDDMIEAQVKKEITLFFEPTIIKGYGGKAEGEEPSEFSKLIKMHMRELLTNKIKGVLNDPEWQAQRMWSYDRSVGGDREEIVLGSKIQEMMNALIPDMVELLFKDIVERTLNKVKESISSGIL